MHGDRIARLREIRGALDRAERSRLGTGVGIIAICGDMEVGGLKGGGERNSAHEYNHGSCQCFGPFVK
jgi:hypothetical protein